MGEGFHIDTTPRVGMVLCTAGSREVLINGILYRISEGMLCFRSPLISIYELSREADYSEAAIIDTPDAFYESIKLVFDTIQNLRVLDRPVLQLDAEKIHFFLAQKERIEQKRACLQGVENKDEAQLVRQTIHLLEQETILEIIHLYHRRWEVETVVVERGKGIAFGFIHSLYLHFRTHRTVAFYAAEAHLSPGHFTRIVKEHTGKPPSEWIAVVTIIHAKLFLKKPGISIKEVAAELNFPEQFTFRKFFKLHTGLSPRDYRRQHAVEE